MVSNYYHDDDAHIVRMLMSKVFAWLTLAISLSGVSAYVASGIPAFQSGPVTIFLVIMQLAMVFLLASSINTLSYTFAQVLFVLYSITTGLTTSVIFSLYKIESIAQVFLCTAAMFALMALYGFYTKTDITQYRPMLMMALWGLIIALIVNIFVRSSAFDTILSGVGVLVFAALTSFDIKIIKNMAHLLIENGQPFDKIALVCALQLYLDFINLFINMLRLFAREEQQ